MAFPEHGHIIPLLALTIKLVPFHYVTLGVSAEKMPQLKARDLIGSFEFSGLEFFSITEVIDLNPGSG